MTRFLFCLLFLCPSLALADEGEVYLELPMSFGVGSVSNPRAGSTMVFDELSSLPLSPSLGLQARYGLTNTWHVGVGFVGSFAPNVLARSVSYEGYVGDLYAHQMLLQLPVTASYRLDLGYDYTGVFEASISPTLALWDHNRAGVPGRSRRQGTAVDVAG